jgi:AcrR family transcriptional regulator
MSNSMPYRTLSASGSRVLSLVPGGTGCSSSEKPPPNSSPNEETGAAAAELRVMAVAGPQLARTLGGVEAPQGVGDLSRVHLKHRSIHQTIVCDESTVARPLCGKIRRTYVSMQSSTAERRRYRKRRRAELEAETRLRITQAAVDLHESIGPARTTISAVADRASVQRGTVYRHFPDEDALFEACSSHWMAHHPLPDIAAWAAVEDPEERLRTALEQVYAWYERGASMLETTTRDLAVVPALRPSMESFAAWLDSAVDSLVHGRPERGARRRRARAAIGHALSFETWRSLVREQRLSAGEAIELMAGLVVVC